MKSWTSRALGFVLAAPALLVGAQLTTWDNQVFEFGWTPYEPTIQECSKIQIGWHDRADRSPKTTPPYTIGVLSGGYQPIILTNTEQTLGYNWTVGLPVGGPYILYMKDAANYTGGTSLVFNVPAAGNGASCGSAPPTANSLQITTNGTNAECSAIVATVSNGQPPYTMQIVGGERPLKTSTWTTSTLSYIIDMKPTEQFFVVITDANGLVGVDGIHDVTPGSDACYNIATTVSSGSLPTTISYDPANTGLYASASGSPTSSAPASTTSTAQSSSVPLPIIIGASVGGAALLLIIALIIFFWRRRAAKQKAVSKMEERDRRRLSGPPTTLPFNSTRISPFGNVAPVNTPGVTAPLMSHMSSNYSSGSNGDVYTPPACTPGVSYFGQGAGGGPPQQHQQHQQQQTPWSIPVTTPNRSNSSYSYSTNTNPNPLSPALSTSTGVTSSGSSAIPPGAMAPQIGVKNPLAEKAVYNRPSATQAGAPPPYKG